MLHTVNCRGVRLGYERTGVLAREVLNGAGEVVVELLELEPKCQALELPLELAPGGHFRRQSGSAVLALNGRRDGRLVSAHGIEGRDVGRLGPLYVGVVRYFGLGAKVGAGLGTEVEFRQVRRAEDGTR